MPARRQVRHTGAAGARAHRDVLGVCLDVGGDLVDVVAHAVDLVLHARHLVVDAREARQHLRDRVRVGGPLHKARAPPRHTRSGHVTRARIAAQPSASRPPVRVARPAPQTRADRAVVAAVCFGLRVRVGPEQSHGRCAGGAGLCRDTGGHAVGACALLRATNKPAPTRGRQHRGQSGHAGGAG